MSAAALSPWSRLSRRAIQPTTGCPPRRLSAVLAALAVALVLGVPVVAAPVAAADVGCGTGAVGCFPRMAFGLATPGLPTSTTGLHALESSVGHHADVGLSFSAFKYSLDTTGLRALALAGTMPMITWEPFDPSAPTADRYPLRSITAGTYDVYLRAQAARIRTVGERVALRFGHEMNGGWYPWGAGVNGNTPADYVAAYRHVHDVFAAAGVQNVTWVWSPSALDTTTAPDLSLFYPGDAYVDWAGLSVYYDQPTDTWPNTVGSTVRQLDRVAPAKPIYLAEAAVLPGSTRPAMIHELLGSLLRTPRAIGFTWFDIAARYDWRVDSDPTALSAIRSELSSGWYGSAAVVAGMTPMLQVPPALTGIPRVGASLTATNGAWRGATETSGRWLLCADSTAGSCAPAGVSGPTFTPTIAALGQTVRYEVVATSVGGTTTGISTASAPVLTTPARPGRPNVEARSGSARVTFPVAPLGTTHWRLRLDGAAKQLVPVGAVDYWLTGLTNGTSYTLGLTAVAVSSAATLESTATAGTFRPMTQPYSPYVLVTGPAASFTLPKPPVGAEAWVLTVNGVEQRLSITTATASVSGLATGQPQQWSLVAGAGTWDGTAFGALSMPSTGAFTPLATPAAPVVTPGVGTITLLMPSPPTGATGWRVTVGATTYPDLAVETTSFTATGRPSGYSSTWNLRAVNATARSLPVTGTAAAL